MRTARRQGPRAQLRCAGAVVLAVCAHLLALFLLGLRIPGMAGARAGEDRVVAMQVTLVRPQRLPPAPRGGESPGPAPATRASPRVLITPTPGAPALSAPMPNPPSPPQAEASADGEKLRNALRGLMGCANPAALRLSGEERATCDQRLAAAAPAPVGSPLSPEELEQFNADKPQDSILVRKLRNGCLPRLGDRPPPTIGRPLPTRSGANTTFGAGCAWSF